MPWAHSFIIETDLEDVGKQSGINISPGRKD